jgi:poly-beta-1,6-N-acetyl-D-glucosamine biosynthesis protein PgaD
MSATLIIDARDRLRWHQRLFSDASTAAMWAAWFWLWSPMLRATDWLAFGSRSYPAVMKLLAATSAGGIEHSVVALVGTSGTLLVWNRLPAPRARVAEVQSLRDYARYFELAEHDLRAGQRAAVCVVHHDESGRIVRLECREPEGVPEALAG